MHSSAVTKAEALYGSAERIRLQPIARITAGLLVVRAALWVGVEPYWAVADLALAAVALVMDRILGRKRYTARAVEFAAIGMGGLAVCGSLLRVYRYQEPCEAAVVGASILGAACILRGNMGFYSFSGIALFSWLSAASATRMPAEQLVQVSCGLLGALALAVWMRNEIAGEQARAASEMDLDRKGESERRRITESLNGAGVGLWYWDLTTGRFSTSSQWTALLGIGDGGFKDVSTANWFRRVHPYYEADLQEAIAKHLAGGGGHFEYEYRIQHEDGDYRWVQVWGEAIRDNQNKPIALAGGQVDASHLVAAENRMMQDALHDRLTGLPNRQAFLLRLKRAFEEMQRD